MGGGVVSEVTSVVSRGGKVVVSKVTSTVSRGVGGG